MQEWGKKYMHVSRKGRLDIFVCVGVDGAAGGEKGGGGAVMMMIRDR